MRNFQELTIWKDSMNLAKMVYALSTGLPSSEKFGLISQMRRCSVSIPSNIAEGCSRGDKGFSHFLSIALGSAYELQTQLLLTNSVHQLNQPQYTSALDLLNKTQRSILSFKQRLQKFSE